MQILAVFVTGIVVIFVIKEVRYAQKRMNEMEEKLKKLERGWINYALEISKR